MFGGSRAGALAAAGAVLLALVSSACGERAEPIGPRAHVYPVTVVDDADRPVTIARPAQRIALLDPSLEPLFIALGARSQIAGIPVTNGGALRAGRLAKLHADFVVAAPGVDDATLSAAARVAKAPAYVLPGSSIREVERGITQAGMITARPLEARRLVHGIEAARETVRAHVGGRSPTTVFVDIGGFQGATDQSLIGDLIREAHGRNVSGRGGISPIAGVTEIVRVNPAVYVAVKSSGTDLRSLRQGKRTRKLKAVRTGRVVVVDDRLLAPGPAIGRGLVELARALHPTAMP